MKHFVIDSYKDKIEDNIYHICLNKDCDVVYFDSNMDLVIKKDFLKIPIWFKKEADPKYICYCNQVTENQIFDAVINKGAKDINDIIKITGAMKNGKCEVNNPLGKCCSPIIKETINKAMKIKDSGHYPES